MMPTLVGSLRARRLLADTIFTLLVVWTIVAVGLVSRTAYGRLRPRVGSAAAASPDWSAVPNWRDLGSRGYRMGSPASRTVAIVFSDFQCPYCRSLSFLIDSLHRQSPTVEIVERHLPLVQLHGEAMDAALAAECSADVGRYGEMRHELFSKRGMVEDGDWGRLAQRAGVADTSALVKCVADRKHVSVVEADMQAAKRIGITGTPGIIVNGYLHQGSLSLAALEKRLATAPAK